MEAPGLQLTWTLNLHQGETGREMGGRDRERRSKTEKSPQFSEWLETLPHMILLKKETAHMDRQTKRGYLMNWMAKLHKLHSQQASTVFLSLECDSQQAILKAHNAKLPSPQHVSTSDTTGSYSVVEFVKTLTWFIRCFPFGSSLSHRGFVTFFSGILFKSSHWSKPKIWE